MSIRPIRDALIAGLLLFALPALASPETGGTPEIEAVLDEAAALTEAGRPEAALLLLRPLLLEGHRAPEFLFEAGNAALTAAGREGIAEDLHEALLDESILLLRAVLQQQPKHTQARFLLASALSLRGKDALARQHFEQVLASRPPPYVAAWIHEYFEAPSAPRRWFGYLGTAIGWDSNIAAASDDKHIWMDTEDLVRLPYRRSASQLPQSGAGLSVWGGMVWEHPLTPRLGLRAGADAVRREQEGRRFDLTWLGLHLGPHWKIHANRDVSLLVEVKRQWAAEHTVHSAIGLRLDVEHRPTPRLDLRVSAGWWRDNYPENAPDNSDDPDACLDEDFGFAPEDYFDACIDDAPTSRNGPAGYLSVRVAWMATPELQLRASLGHDWERPAAPVWRNRSAWGRIGAMLLLPRGFLLDGSVELRRTRYEQHEDIGWREGPHFTDDEKRRRDHTRTFRASLGNSRFAFSGFDPELAFVHEVNATNAQVEDYRRNRVELRFTRRY